MNKNQYYCITKNNVVIYISTSEKACYKEFYKLHGDCYNVSKIDMLGVFHDANLKNNIKDGKVNCEKRPLEHNKEIEKR